MSNEGRGGDGGSGVPVIGSAALVLAELDWDDGFAIPLQRLQKEKANLQNQLSDYEDRVTAMSSHLKNVKQEFDLTQCLFRARQNEIETEQHFKAVAEREVGRLKTEIQKLENDLVSLREKKNSQENNVFKLSQKLEALRCQMNWDQQALEAWLEESAHKDNDALTIQKYAQQDDGKLRKLSLQIEILTVNCNNKRRILDNELTETLAAQIELDKTADDFRRVHQERQDLIRQWENTIEQMQKRDQEIDSCALLLAQARRAIRVKESVLKDKVQFLANESGNNIEFEKRISIADRQAAKLRLEYQTEENNREALQNELDTLKAIVDGTASELESMRSLVANLKKDIQDKTLRLNLIRDQNETLANKLKFVTYQALSEEEKACKMEELLKEKEKIMKEKETQALQLRDAHFKKTKELQALQENEKSITSLIEGHGGQKKNLKNRLRRLDIQALSQQELMYNQDFYIQQVERRLSRLKGELNTDERQILEGKLAELIKIMDEKKQAFNTLQSQEKKLQSEIHFSKLAIDKTGEEMIGLNTRLDEINLFTDKSDKLLKKARAEKQDLMIEDNLLKLELKRVRDLLYNKAEKVLCLEKRKQQLKTAMEERMADIKVHKEMIETQTRLIEQERQTLSSEFHERLSKIEKLKSRYEIITIVMMPPEGEEEKTQAYYVIKAAQEKEDLQREGDTLDAKIQKAEKECIALENTLHVLNNCNSQYRNSFKQVVEKSEEFKEKTKLEEEKRATDEKHRYKRRQIKELQEDIQTMQNNFDTLVKKEVLLQEKKEDKHANVLKLIREIDDQKPRIERVSKQVSRLTREIRALQGTQSEIPEEKDIELRALKDFSKYVDKMLLDISEAHPELHKVFQKYFGKASLHLPTVSASHFSVRSVHGSASIGSFKSSYSGHPHAKVVSLTLDPRPEPPGPVSRPSSQSSATTSSHSKSPY
ncbi:Coiled-coil domain-containing protein 39, partial [Ophiophagus hannah]